MTAMHFYDGAVDAKGYPLQWHDLGEGVGVKHLVRDEAGHRCVRCHHPFVCGKTPAEWSPCEAACTHRGPARSLTRDGEWEPLDLDEGREAIPAGFYVEAGLPLYAQWRVLTVHHLDGCKRNCRWWNLAALCQRCHLQVQGRVDMARIWPWPHTDWFRPYAAGYYAHVYLGEDLSRAETVGRLDELLALELQAAA